MMFPTINTNKENVSGPLPQPNVKIIDLQHNLLPFESNSSESINGMSGSGMGMGIGQGSRNMIDS
jgi:hypothetical protein